MGPALEMVFFDIGGVMYDDTIYARAMHTALRALGGHFTDEEFDEVYRSARAAQAGSFRGVLARRFLGPGAEMDAVEAEASKHWAYPPAALHDDVRPCLDALAGTYRLGIIANQPATVKDALRRDRLDGYFEVWGVSDDVGLEKPDPALFTHALAEARVVPRKSAMVGDRLDYDVRPAKTAGMRAVWVLRGEAPDDPTPGQLSEADAAIRGLVELPAALQALGGGLVTTKRILIVGGGFAGMYAAMEMERLVDAGHALTLVSAENFMQYQPFLPEVASGTIDPRAVVVPLRPLLKHATVEVGEVTSIDHEARRVQVRIPDGASVGLVYDVLVVTAGSWSRVLPVPGLAEHGIGFKTVQEAIYLRNHVLSRLDVASETEDAERRRSALTFVFVGAGYAGVEALGELEDLARDAMRNYPMLRPREMRWILVEAAGRILPELPEDLAAYARVQLEHRNIEVLLETRLDSAEEGTIRLSDGQAFSADTLVWTAGVKPSPLAGLGGFPVDDRGRIVVDDHLRVVGVPDAWAAGDIAAVPDRTTGGLAPPTAQHAMREGRRLGRNVTATLLGGELAPFVWKNVGGVCSLGRYKGVANVFGIKVKGFLGWFLHRSYHLWAMPTIGRRVRIAIDWTIALLFPRDITQFGSFEDPRAPFRRAAQE